ncbi:helix-turn-helix domain-containing protein [Winogradskyella sp. PE311]|uniref:AraC family transcriptional regulator n=1 Tax=Winogradskyella sp. PE311 TaxID=3366943 RepID=UPI0039811241
MNVVSINIYKKVYDLAIEEGLSSNLLSHHKEILDEYKSNYFVPFNLLLDVYELGNKYLESGFEIRVGKNMLPEDYGTLGLSWKTSLKARDVFERTIRFNILITDVSGFQVENKEDLTIVSINRPTIRLGHVLSNVATLTVCVKMIREITQKEINPTKVTFVHNESEYNSNYSKFFNCEVNFSDKTNSIHFLNKDLDIPTAKADKSISAFLLERLEEEKKGIEKQANHLVSDISLLIKDALSSGIPSIQSISQLLAMSNRTLTRRLSKSGITFRDIIKTTQLKLAKKLLLDPTKSIGEIAFLTGFSEQSAFNRAFKKWTNQTPSEFRKSI